MSSEEGFWETQDKTGAAKFYSEALGDWAVLWGRKGNQPSLHRTLVLFIFGQILSSPPKAMALAHSPNHSKVDRQCHMKMPPSRCHAGIGDISLSQHR